MLCEHLQGKQYKLPYNVLQLQYTENLCLVVSDYTSESKIRNELLILKLCKPYSPRASYTTSEEVKLALYVQLPPHPSQLRLGKHYLKISYLLYYMVSV